MNAQPTACRPSALPAPEGSGKASKRRGRAAALGLLLGAALLPAAEALAQPPLTRVQTFTYDPATALLTQQVSEPDDLAIALTTDYTYDGFGNQLTATVSGPDIANRTTSATFSADGRFMETATNALSHSETHVTDARFGTVTSLTGPNALATTWTYDGFGRKTVETRADGTETRWTYELCVAQCPTGGVYMVTAQDFNSGGFASTAKAIEYLDKLNRVFRSETEGFDGTPVYVDTEYDARGRVHRVSKPYFQGTAAIDILWTTNSYDVLGRLLSVTLPDGGVESTAYSGLTTTLTNALTQTSVRVENAVGELISATDNLSNVTTYSYDSHGNLLETNAAGVVTTMTYDIRGLKLTMDDPDMGDWSYAYNALGELTSQTDAKAQVTTMTYDLLGRMATRTETEGTTTWTYDTAAKGIGKIHTVSAADPAMVEYYAETMTYDSLGRPSLASVTLGGETYDTSTLYDTAGRADTLVYPSGFTVKSVFTARGHLAEVTDSAGTLEYWRADTVNAEGQVTAETLGNDVTTTRVYDPATSRIDSISTVKPGAPATTIQDLAFDFDFIGNLTARRDLLQNREEAFTYDGLNRLTGTTLTDTATLATLTNTTYTYDSLGNITNKSDVGVYTYGTGAPGQPGPHAVVSAGGNSYTYDANGSMETGAGKTTTWTSFNKPELIVDTLTSDETGFVYGPSRARITQQIIKGGLTTSVTYVGSHFEKKERFGEDDELVHYIRAGATIAIFTEYRDAMDAVTDSKTRYTHRDHLGSIASLTDELGVVTETLSYDPHGKRRLADWQAGSPVDPAETPRGFTGHEHLDAVGLIHMNGRVYDPTLGRFLSADPLVLYPETTQGFNRYSYTDNNPLSYTDPSGFGWLDGNEGERNFSDTHGDWGTGTFDEQNLDEWGERNGIDISFEFKGDLGLSKYVTLRERRAIAAIGVAGVETNAPDDWNAVDYHNAYQTILGSTGLTPKDWSKIAEIAAEIQNARATAALQGDYASNGKTSSTKPDYNQVLDRVQTALDVAGLTPGVGNFADIANAMISVARGDWVGAMMNLGQAVPVVGQGIAASKFAGAALGVAVRPGSRISVDEALGVAGDFMKEGIPIKSVNGTSGVQFIQEYQELGQKITKRAGFDLNPNSSHVRQLGPHLNLQTQINGVVQRKGPLKDPHIPIDPKTIRSGDY